MLAHEHYGKKISFLSLYMMWWCSAKSWVRFSAAEIVGTIHSGIDTPKKKMNTRSLPWKTKARRLVSFHHNAMVQKCGDVNTSHSYGIEIPMNFFLFVFRTSLHAAVKEVFYFLP